CHWIDTRSQDAKIQTAHPIGQRGNNVGHSHCVCAQRHQHAHCNNSEHGLPVDFHGRISSAVWVPVAVSCTTVGRQVTESRVSNAGVATCTGEPSAVLSGSTSPKRQSTHMPIISACGVSPSSGQGCPA